MSLALVRHGRTAWNHERRMQGRTDIELDDTGRAQGEVAGGMLARHGWTRVVSSPLLRAIETAQIIARTLPAMLHIIDPGLTERDYGDAEGLPVAEAHARWPAHDYPRAELLTDVARRSAACLEALWADGGDAIVVAHGTVLRVGIEKLTGEACPRILNGEVITLDRNAAGRFRAVRLTA